MNHVGTVEIETDRLLLRRFTEADVPAVFNNWTSDDRVTEYLRWPTHGSMDTTRAALNGWIGSYEAVDFYQWAIVPKGSDGEPVGTIGVVDTDGRLGMVRIGYCIGSGWWNRGYATEAFLGIIPFLFDVVGVNRIEAQHDPNNPGSGKVMAKCGLRHEGTLRQADFSNKGIVDASVYGLLASEYRAKARTCPTVNPHPE